MKIPQMKNPKVFWGSLLAADAILVVLFGWALYTRIAAPPTPDLQPPSQTQAALPVPKQEEKPLPPEIEKDAEKSIEESVKNVEKAIEKADKTIASVSAPAPKKQNGNQAVPRNRRNRSASSSAQSPWEGKPKAQKVLIEYRNKQAKKVSVAFSFAGYKPRAMKKSNGGIWTHEEYLTPGSYQYYFVVDGKETPDPANPRRKGKNSILPVE